MLKLVNIWRSYKQESSCLVHFLGLLAVCWPDAQSVLCGWVQLSTCAMCFVTAAINRLCGRLNCDDQCEVAAVSEVADQTAVVEAYCTCAVGFMRVRVQPDLKCNSK